VEIMEPPRPDCGPDSGRGGSMISTSNDEEP